MASTHVLGLGAQTVVHPHRTYGTRTVPMKVLCLGYGRTGTTSPRDQLLTLGFHHSYHTFDALHRDFYDCKIWTDLIVAKHDCAQKPSRDDFDKMLGHCQAVLDMPAAYFAEELIEYYPEAKVILTIRDSDDWFRSQKNSIKKVNAGWIPWLLGFTAQLLLMPDRWSRPLFAKLQQVLYDNDFDRNGVMSMHVHYDKVRSLVAPGNLLEYHVSDGWEPLCSFLDVPVPQGGAALPHINKRSEFGMGNYKRRMSTVKGQLWRLLDVAAYVSLGHMVLAVLVRRLRFVANWLAI